MSMGNTSKGNLKITKQMRIKDNVRKGNLKKKQAKVTKSKDNLSKGGIQQTKVSP